MNKELIKKYSKEFNHWINGGKLLAKHDNKGWINYYGEDIWTHSAETLIVIDDEYSMFRKALIEGESIEVLQSNTERWVNIGTIIESIKPELYRIKPNKPERHKFKKGDWVIHNGKYKRVTKAVDGYIDSLDNEVAVIMKEESLELWEPEEEEYFWYKNDLVKFHETQANLGLLLKSARGCSYYPAEKNFEDFCEPYLGRLPSNLKQDNTSISVE
jgi:hypothetical protein